MLLPMTTNSNPITVVPVDTKHSGYSCQDCVFTTANPFDADRHVNDENHTVTYTVTETREIRKVTV